MKADIYYPIVEQGAYGDVKKQWVYNKTITCNFTEPGRIEEEVKPNVNITLKKTLVGRVKKDVRIAEDNTKGSITNVIITNIRDRNDNPIYLETAGPRSGFSTIYEIETQNPVVGPFGSIEYYSLIVRRSENQATDL
jgi:hypothetical protein